MKIDELKDLLRKFHIYPSKSMGQNFLLSDKALQEIVEAAELETTDTVLEIGPGLGVLTKRLGQEAGLVLAVEKDHKIYEALRRIFRNQKNIKIISGDALFFNPEDYNLKASTYKLVANIPYYITGKLLQSVLGGSAKPSLMVLLLQKEVAERITAAAGDMSILSVSVQFYADPEIISYVSRDEFYPSPEVDSAVLRLKMLSKPRFDLDERKFFQLVKIGFAGKRKQLHNNLQAGLKNVVIAREPAGERGNLEIASSGTPRNDRAANYKHMLQSIGLDPLCRAQDLSLGDWEKLYKLIMV